MSRQLRVAMLVLALSLPAVAKAQQSSPPSAPAPSPAAQAARDGFVPVSELPPTEQLPASPLVLGAYGFIWAAVLAYVFSLSRRLSAVQKDIETLTRRR